MGQRLVLSIDSFSILKSALPYPNFSSTKKIMPLKTAAAAALPTTAPRKLPILLFDVMDTIVRDPFYHDVPDFFGMSMKELLECKHPTAWIEFEKGLIDEIEMIRIFFKDGRPVDLEGLKSCMRQGYSYIEGVEVLLDNLKKNGFEMHAFTNYPVWYEIIEEKLTLSSYLSWTFCSCKIDIICVLSNVTHDSNELSFGVHTDIFAVYCYGVFCTYNLGTPAEAPRKRKPDRDFYMDVSKYLKVDPASCIFIDDRIRNVEAAVDAGFIGIQFKNVELLCKDLTHFGIHI